MENRKTSLSRVRVVCIDGWGRSWLPPVYRGRGPSGAVVARGRCACDLPLAPPPGVEATRTSCSSKERVRGGKLGRGGHCRLGKNGAPRHLKVREKNRGGLTAKGGRSPAACKPSSSSRARQGNCVGQFADARQVVAGCVVVGCSPRSSEAASARGFDSKTMV